MKINVQAVIFICCLAIISTAVFGADTAKEKKKKTVVIKYDPDNKEVTKVIALETVSYETVEPFCRKMLSETGTIGYLKERQSVIIFDKKKNAEKIAAFLKKIDVPAVNIRIDVDFLQTGTSGHDSLNVRYGNSKLPRANNRIIIKNGKLVKIDNLAISAKSQRGTSTRNTSTFILTRSGHPARIWVGRTIVDPTWLANRVLVPTVIVPTGGGGVIVVPGSDNDIVWRDVGSELYVLPTYLGDDKIKLELYPVVSYIQDDPDAPHLKGKKRRQTVMVQDVKTSLTLQNGQRVSLGGVIGSKKNFYTSLFGPGLLDREGTNSILDMYVTATVIKPGSNGRRSYIPRTPDVRPRRR